MAGIFTIVFSIALECGHKRRHQDTATMPLLALNRKDKGRRIDWQQKAPKARRSGRRFSRRAHPETLSVWRYRGRRRYYQNAQWRSKAARRRDRGWAGRPRQDRQRREPAEQRGRALDRAGSSRSRIRRAAWVKPRPPSICRRRSPSGIAGAGRGPGSSGQRHDGAGSRSTGRGARVHLRRDCGWIAVGRDGSRARPRASLFPLAPATMDLAGAEIELVPIVAKRNRVSERGLVLRDEPGLHLHRLPAVAWVADVNALMAAAGVVIPIQCEYYALEGILSS